MLNLPCSMLWNLLAKSTHILSTLPLSSVLLLNLPIRRVASLTQLSKRIIQVHIDILGGSLKPQCLSPLISTNFIYLLLIIVFIIFCSIFRWKQPNQFTIFFSFHNNRSFYTVSTIPCGSTSDLPRFYYYLRNLHLGAL